MFLPVFVSTPVFAQTSPTFAQDIAPLIYKACAPCHHTGGSGPFPLTSYDDVRKHARQIVAVTSSRFMPPWLPLHAGKEDAAKQDAFEHFVDEPRLTDEQIKTISQWVEQGTAPGDLTKAPPPPVSNTGWTLGEPDLVVEASQPFQIRASGPDVFWNFVLAPHLSKSRYVRAIEIKPRNPKLIHHANIIVDRIGTVTEPFAGMDVSVPRNPLDLDGNFLFFKPGSTVSPEPQGLSWRIDPGSTLILNTHLQPSGKVEVEQPAIGLYFTDQPPTRFPYLLQMEADSELDIPAGVREFPVGDDFKLPVDTVLLAIYPHAHYLGHRLEAFVTMPDGSRKWLIRILDWNPAWQSVYRYRDPVHLPAGTVISMRYRYDNSKDNPRNPNTPPQRVQAGNGAADEMAHLWLQIMPASSRDSRRVYAEAWAQHELEKNPENYAANMTLGSLALARFDALSAVQPLEAAAAENPKDALAHNLYGTALAATSRNTEAQAQFQVALELRPDLVNARLNLAHSLQKAGRKEEAIHNLQMILHEYPGDPAAESFLQQILKP